MAKEKAREVELSDRQVGEFEGDLRDCIEGEVRFDRIFRAMHATDASVYEILPLGVIIPKSHQDVVRTVKLCNKYSISITSRGGGTSQAGQAIGAGIIIDFSKYMNNILELDTQGLKVKVQPGIVLDNLNHFLKEHSLQLPLDISSSNRATIGGMIGNNAAGARSVIYGKTIDYVIELTAVLSDGSIAKLNAVDNDALKDRCAQENLAADCYKVVKKLSADCKEEIVKRYPKILRRVGGYNLDAFIHPEKPFNLSKIMVGSEGTLGIVVEAVLRLVDLHRYKAVCVVHFSELLEAMEAVPEILEHSPSAIELVDRYILSTTRGKTEYRHLSSFMTGDPDAILIVEFFGDTIDELPEKISGLEHRLREIGLGYHIYKAIDSSSQENIWKLRKAALGLSMSATGDPKAIPFVEDTAVSPENLRNYIERFRNILSKYDTEAGYYAHASVGLLHIRPIINMKSGEGVEKFRKIAEEISDLVLEFGGAVSGEHGDGLARSPFQEKMFGSVIYKAFCDLKKTFDPQGILNPGKIVHAPPITENLKFGAGYETWHVETVLDFSDFGGILRAAEQCSGVGKCRKDLNGSMCPSFMATKDESASTRGRANALRMALSGKIGPDSFTDKEMYSALQLCLECKACKTECPTGVDMARMKSEFLHHYHTIHKPDLRSKVLANVDRLAQIGSRFGPLSNWIIRNWLMRFVLEKTVHIDARRKLPTIAQKTLYDWWNQRPDKNSVSHNKESNSIAIFADTFLNFFDPDHGIAAISFAEQLGYKVTIPPRVCCGRSLISKGFLKEAKVYAENTINALAPLAEKGTPVIFCEPGCLSAIKDDHQYLLRGEMKKKGLTVASACLSFEEWVENILNSRDENKSALKKPAFNAGPKKILYHGHCHQKALTGLGHVSRLLSAIPESSIEVLDSGCCGMAGSFGYERENYAVSKTIGNRKLFPAVEGMESDSVIVGQGFSCRSQIKHFTGVDALSTMKLLNSLIASGPKS